MNARVRALSLLLMVGTAALAEKKSSDYQRGGFGFLFADANAFENGGQLALNKGFGVAGKYLTSSEGNSQSATPSIVMANGKLGFGVYGSRSGTTLSESSADTVGFSGGLALAHQKITLGTVYSRGIGSAQSDDGVVAVQLNLNLGKSIGMGPSLGVEWTTSLNRDYGDTKTGKAAIGWAFNGVSSIEASFSADDLTDTSNYYSIAGALKLGTGKFYVSGEYAWIRSGTMYPNRMAARGGLILNKFDLYAEYSKVLLDSEGSVYGGAIRILF